MTVLYPNRTECAARSYASTSRPKRRHQIASPLMLKEHVVDRAPLLSCCFAFVLRLPEGAGASAIWYNLLSQLLLVTADKSRTRAVARLGLLLDMPCCSGRWLQSAPQECSWHAT